MSSQRLYCGPEKRDRLGDDERSVSLHVSARGFSLASVSDDRDRLIATADLRYADLLAAAPEMLEILNAIVEDVGYVGGGAKLCENFLGRARAAIAKAGGR